MPFTQFKELQDVALAYEITLRIEEFIVGVPFQKDEAFKNDLDWTLKNIKVNISEWAVCEFLIAPILKKVWMPYSESLSIWSHVPFGVEEPLTGVPDYYFSRRSPHGVVREPPYVLVVQAKKDDFEGGWGQCLAAMLAAQQINGDPGRAIHGIVSNGFVWTFGKLEAKVFTQDIRYYTISNLAELFAAVNYVFLQAKAQALAPAA